MEIYSQTVNTVEFETPEATTPVTVTASLDDGDPVSLTLVSGTENTNPKRAVLPYIPNNGEVKVNWTFTTTTFNGSEPVTITDTYDVVTPILSNKEVKAIHPNATDAEIVKIEKAVRHVIQAHTGQVFGKFVGSIVTSGNDSSRLQLPARLISLDTINGDSALNQFEIEADGWVLKYYPWGVPPVKADYYGYHQHVGGVIHNPHSVKLGDFRRAVSYSLAGVWGWEEVPAQVREAAKLLVNDYACADQAYRDRYLTSMTAADWRIQYHSGAFQKTGNVRADQLLSNFVLQRGWAVI